MTMEQQMRKSSLVRQPNMVESGSDQMADSITVKLQDWDLEDSNQLTLSKFADMISQQLHYTNSFAISTHPHTSSSSMSSNSFLFFQSL
uniref:Uncharacterized protein n=1 Tax=Panagrolaimus sp. ES5 TaxID=591445 RepID=A0AC34FFL9_9BILA